MEVKLLYIIGSLVLLIYLDSCQIVQAECPVNIKLLCYEQTNCVDCLRFHPCCHWCYQTNFNGTSRCGFLDELSQCGSNIEENKDSSITIKKDKHFTKITQASDAPDAIQIRPQSFKIDLRPDSPVNLTFTYKAAKNYPLELYYLGDLSYSMKAHLETLKNLGDDLDLDYIRYYNLVGRSLEKLTKHYKLAYGSFLDKPGMPFIYTDEKNRKNPCQNNETCEAAYLFKHRLSFTDNIDRFFEEVRTSKISANVDDLDGALDAIFQILVCDKKFGWSPYSRKMILLSTDSLLHIAGDGILAGATGVNYEGLCLVNDEGDYTDPLKYDYPSIGQIKTLLRSYKVNLIVAVTKDKISTYKNMKKGILEQEAFVGELQDSSRNILELVRTGFFNFIRQVDFSANVSHAPELDVQFFGKCDGNSDFNITSGCQNVEEESPLTFKLQLTLKQTSKSMETVYIREKNINEEIEIVLNYVGCNCECPNYNTSHVLECVHGFQSCGSCICEAGWQGETCSEECNQVPGACRDDENSRTCNGRGDCECGKCICPPPYTGKYCQWQCPANKYGIPCNAQGSCIEGKCNCRNGYTGDDCTCETSTDSCKLTGSDESCNAHGDCKCNRCECYEGFRGTYCEIRKSSNDFCEMYESFVQVYSKNNTKTFKKGEVNILVQELQDKNKCDVESICTVVSFTGTQRCHLNFCYRGGENNTVYLYLGSKNEKCDITAQAMGYGAALGIFITIILGGSVLIFLKKWQIRKADKAEYKRFVEESKNFSEMNPLYKSPVTEFRNPMARNKN